jgi:bifunctional non-homologous end joining protein LigD
VAIWVAINSLLRRHSIPVRVATIKRSHVVARAYPLGAGHYRAVLTFSRQGPAFRAFPFIATAVAELPVKSCLIDGEAIVCDENGLAVFDLIRRHGAGERAVLSAFDLLELDGKDLRRRPIETRKAVLAKLLNGSHLSLVLNEHYEEDGEIVFREACKLGCEGIVSKRLGSVYRRGRSPLWLKVKNPNAPAAKRESEEDWGRS